MKRKIAVITSSRADYAHLRWLLHDLGNDPAIDLRVIAMGPHLSPVFGHTGRSVDPPALARLRASAAIETVECLLDSDSEVGMAKTIGVACLGLADALDRLRPDILLVIADRYEMLAPAAAAVSLRIPLAHVEGGEITVGAIDDAVRNALTKMSHLHFACTRRAAQRIAEMGEEKWRITFSGSLSLDALRRERLLSRAQLEKRLGFEVVENAVVCIYHAVTMLADKVEEAEEVFAALARLKQQIVFIYPNADAGSRELIRRGEEFCNTHRRAWVVVNLEHRIYLSLLKHAGLLVGNSSSGIIESTSLEMPAVNIGIRQLGREHAANVIDVPAKRTAILGAIQKATSHGFRKSIRGLESPYGDGRAAKIIREMLKKAPLGPKLLFKHAELL